MTKKQLRTNLLRAYIAEATGRNDPIADDVLHAALEFNETHVSWKTITRVLSLLKPFVQMGAKDRTEAEVKVGHFQLQEAIAPGIKAGRAELLFKDEMEKPGFYRLVA